MSRFRQTLSEHFREVRERDEKWILQFRVDRLNRILFPLLLALVFLDFADVTLTLLAVYIGPPLVELNPIASALFQRQFLGFVLALSLKYLPLVPFAYLVLMGDRATRPVRVRVLKLGVLVALLAAIVISAAVVTNNTLALWDFSRLDLS